MDKITIFLMSNKGYHVLKEILSSYGSSSIDFIVVAKDSHVTKDFYEEILDLAKEHGLRAISKTSKYQIQTKYLLAVSWRWLITFDESRTQLIVLHDSLLPKYRGFSPLVNQLIHKEPFIGVTAFFADKGYDTGDIIYRKKTAVRYPIKVGDAIVKIIPLYIELVLEIMVHLKKGDELPRLAQNNDEATFSLWRDDKDYEIDWSRNASYIKLFIDAVGFPYLGAYATLQNRMVRIVDAELIQDLIIVNRDFGKVLFLDEGHVVVVCGKGLLKITKAIYNDDKKSIFPLKKFRLRFS